MKLIEELGEDNIMWGSDFPHPDGIYPDSQEYIEKELGHLPAAIKQKIVCDNAAKLYRFVKQTAFGACVVRDGRSAASSP